ncbi:MAG: protein kinase [Nannocystaceae bacterium]
MASEASGARRAAHEVTRVLVDDEATEAGDASSRADGPAPGRTRARAAFDDATRILIGDAADVDDDPSVASHSAPSGPSSGAFATTRGPLSVPLADVLKARLRHGEGARLSRYALLRVLGEGGMGVVFAAYDEELDRRVAIKLLRAPSHGPLIDRAWILEEAKAMAKLSHPNVVQIYDPNDMRRCAQNA